MIVLINGYSNFIYEIAEKAENLLDDLALNSQALKEFQSTYSQEQIDEYNEQLKLDKWFEELEEAERRQAQLDPSTLPDNFWNE